jgi:hypothetical protein
MGPWMAKVENRTYARRVCTIALIADGALTHYFSVDVAVTSLSQPARGVMRKHLAPLAAMGLRMGDGADCRIIWAQKDSKRDEGMLTELCHP